MSTDGAGLEVENEDFFSDPCIVVDSEFPGEMDIHARLDIYLFADISAEKPQQCSLKSRRPGQGRQKEAAFGQIPEGF